jgi:hypothetical protein
MSACPHLDAIKIAFILFACNSSQELPIAQWLINKVKQYLFIFPLDNYWRKHP